MHTPCAAADSFRYETERYELVNDNVANEGFVGANYCLGSGIRDCWIRSGRLTKFSDGSSEVDLEFWDTYVGIPIRIHKKVTDDDYTIFLTDKAKTLDDTAPGYRRLWVVVFPEDNAMGVVYDYAGDGPNVQGDDLLDALEFLKVSDGQSWGD